jgi:hypothetical protein
MRFLCLPRHNHINQFGLSKQGHAQVVATNLNQKSMYNLTMSCENSFIDSINLTNDDSSGTTNETSDKITGKTGNKIRQAMTHTWAPDTSPKLKSLQDLSIRVNSEVIEEVVHHAGM